MNYPEFKQMIEENTDATVSDLVGGVAKLSKPVKMMCWDDGSVSKFQLLIIAFNKSGAIDLDGMAWDYAAPIPKKKKRLMTPAECAGKWLVNHEDNRQFINGYGFAGVSFNGLPEGVGCMSIENLHKDGRQIADTPTSEPYSLEVSE